MDRRGFFISAGRFVLLGSLAAVSAVALTREGDEETSCPTGNFCSRCGILSGCDLPEAERERKKPGSSQIQSEKRT